MVKRGAELDLGRAASRFVRWWREEGGLLAASTSAQVDAAALNGTDAQLITQGWGFDFQWQVTREEMGNQNELARKKMEECIEKYLVESEREERDEDHISATQRKKQLTMEEKARRKQRYMSRS